MLSSAKGQVDTSLVDTAERKEDSYIRPGESQEEEPDSMSVKALNRDARINMFKSAAIPGWGQISNGHWWKVPIIYAGLGFSIYALINNQQIYSEFRESALAKVDTTGQFTDYYSNLPLSVVRTERDETRRLRDISIAATAGIYFLNLIDAYVFAHLKDFDVSDDLSLRVNPPNFGIIAGQRTLTTGIKLKF